MVGSIYMSMVAFLGVILILGGLSGKKGVWHRLSFFDGYAHFLRACGKELYEGVRGSTLQLPLAKYSRMTLAIICWITFSTVFLLVMPAFMVLSAVAMIFNRIKS